MFWFDTGGKSPRIMRRALLYETLVILLAILTMAQSSISALVLCCGDDGHRAIEIAHQQSGQQILRDFHCQTPRMDAQTVLARPSLTKSVSTESVLEKALSPEQPSTTCIDIPLGNDIIVHKIPSLSDSFGHPMRLTPVLPTSSIDFSATSKSQSSSPFFGVSPPPDTPALSLLSTVVLLN